MKQERIPGERADVQDSFLCKLYAFSCVHPLAINSTTHPAAHACEGYDLNQEATHNLLGPVLLTLS